MFYTYIFYRQLDVRTAITAWASSADPTVRRRHLECDDVPTSTEFAPPLSGLVNTQYSRVHARTSVRTTAGKSRLIMSRNLVPMGDFPHQAHGM